MRTEITKSHLNNRICQHCGVKTSAVTPSFYYVFNISLSCNINIPSFIRNLWWDLLLGNHLNCFMIKNPTNSPRIRLNFQAKLYFSKRGKVASAVLYSLIKHAKTSQSQSLVELFKNFDWLTRRQLSITNWSSAKLSVSSCYPGEERTMPLRACLHGGGGPQVGEVTRLAVVEKWPAFTCKVTTMNSTWTRPRLGGIPHLELFTWQNATPADRVTLPGRPGNPPRRVTPPIM